MDAQQFDLTPAPPSQAELDLEHDVCRICLLLDQAARGDDTAWALSTALASLEHHALKRNGLEIDENQKNRLMRAMQTGFIRAAAHLPPTITNEHIFHGHRAAMHQVLYWYLGSEGRAHLAATVLPDARAYARILRNELHNASLLEEIDARAQKMCGSVVNIAAFRASRAFAATTNTSH